MKFFVVTCCLLVGASAIHEEVIKAKWSSFKAQHAKEYDASEESTRLNNFLQATIDIEKHNERYHRGEVSYSLGHNSLSDLSQDEVRSMYLGRRSMSLEGLNITDVPPMANVALPASVDWRIQKIVTPAKDQQRCGSCYAFGTVGVIESAIAKKNPGNFLDLSEQQIVDCSYKIQGTMNNGCGGGHEVVVMQYVSQFGLVEESSYRYQSGTSRTHYSCKQPSGGRWGKGLRFQRVPPMDERALAEAVANLGTMVVPISGENQEFQKLRDGIYDNPRCPKEVDHVVSIIGYGTEGGVDYWLVKNSWGSSWGVNGVGKVRRGVNQCGLVSDSSYSITV